MAEVGAASTPRACWARDVSLPPKDQMWAACNRTGTRSSQSLSKSRGFTPGDELPTRGADEGPKSRAMGKSSPLRAPWGMKMA